LADVKQQTDFIVGPVYFFLTNMKGFWDLNDVSSAQQNTQNHKLMRTVMYSEHYLENNQGLATLSAETTAPGIMNK